MSVGKGYNQRGFWREFLLEIKNYFLNNKINARFRLVALLGIFCLGTATQAQKVPDAAENLARQVDDIFAAYYYTNLDSALYYFGEIAQTARQQHLWRTYLDVVTTMAWCADHHKNIDTLQHFLQLGEQIAVRHQAALDTLDPDHISRDNLAYTRGMFYYSSGDFEAAIHTFKQIVISEDAPVALDSMLAFDTYSFIGHAYYRLENYEQAITYHQMAARWLPAQADYYEAGHERGYQQALNQFYLGKCNLALAEYGFRKSGYQQAKSLFQKSLDTLLLYPKNIAHKNAIISLYNALAQVYEHQEKYDSSLYFLQKSLAYHLPNDTELLHTYLYLGNVHFRQGNYPQALAYYQQRLKLAQQKFTGKHYQKAISLYKIGAVYAHQHHFDDALHRYQQAMAQLVNAFDATDIFATPPPQAPGAEKELLEVLLLKADALHKLYRLHPEKSSYLSGAIQTYHVAVELVDKMRQKFPSIEYKQFLSAKALSIYEQALLLAQEAYQQEDKPEVYFAEAFFIAEKSKSALLLEAVKNAEAKDFAGIPKALLEQENDLKRKLSYWEKRLYELAPNDEKAAQIKDKLFSLEQTYHTFIKNLEEKYPAYFRLKYDTRVIPVEEVQQFLPGNTALISYFYGDSSLFVLAATAQKQVFRRVALKKKFRHQFHSFMQSLTEYDINQGYNFAHYTTFNEMGGALYQSLMAPVLTALTEKPSQLIILPDGPLGYLPFDILLTHKKGGDKEKADYASLPYMMKQYRIRYEYSATLLTAQAAVEREKATINYAGFAPVYRKEDALAKMDDQDDVTRGDRSKFGNLAHNQEEVSYAKKLFGGIAFEGEAATEQAFKQYAGQSNVLHLSMHAFTNDQHPEYSGMVFTARNDTAEDDFLYAYELYNMQLQADLAILSACETGAGTLARGEGILSLGRAFKYAGCPNVAMNLWKVIDRTTAQIMKAFCENLKQGMAKDEALRQAKLSYLSDPANSTVAHPHFWAPFILVGNDAPVTSSEASPNVWLYLFFAALLITAFGWWFVKNKKQKELAI